MYVSQNGRLLEISLSLRRGLVVTSALYTGLVSRSIAVVTLVVYDALGNRDGDMYELTGSEIGVTTCLYSPQWHASRPYLELVRV